MRSGWTTSFRCRSASSNTSTSSTTQSRQSARASKSGTIGRGAGTGAFKPLSIFLKSHSRLRKNGFPYYKLSKKEKLEELRELLRNGPAPIVDGEVTQTMDAQGFCWSYHPHSWEVGVTAK